MNEKQAKLLLDRYRNVIVPNLYEEIRAIKTLPKEVDLCVYIDDLLQHIHDSLNIADSDIEVKPSIALRESTWAYKSARSLVKSLVEDRTWMHTKEEK
jgi:hypothetical protein